MNNPETYAKYNYIVRQFADDITGEFEDELGEMSGRCIDIGTGPGDVLVDFVLPKLNTEATVVCSDIADPMVEFGKKKYKGNDRLSFIKLDIETPDLPKDLIGQFDHATSFYCIHWCQDMRLVFENIFNLLRPGGTTLIIFIANYPALNAYKKLAVMPRYQPYLKDADRYIPVFQDSEQPQKTLKALLKDVGFEVRHCSVRKQTYTHESLDAFSKFMLAVNPFIDRIPADLAEEFEKDLVKEATGQSIVLNKNDENESEYKVLCVYKTFMAYLRKP